ncbi:MAG: hypothetical protein IKX47_03860, partial [Oscillospiraceae bacterium]|nr:hypothetical protein [Oscillospiraceae bacterium]
PAAPTVTAAPAPARPAVSEAPVPADEPVQEVREPRDTPLREETAEEPSPGVSFDLPPQEVTIRPAPGKQVYTVSPEVLAGLLQGSPEVQDQSGGKMDEDTIQLALTHPDERKYLLPVAAALGGAFILGFGYELGRYRRLLKGKRRT